MMVSSRDYPPSEPAPEVASPAKTRGRPSKRTLKRKALLEGATSLFNARGISGTSLADVAETLGLSRASVYYYVNDRSELVFQCYMRACELTAEDLAAASSEKNGFLRVVDFIRRALTPARPSAAVLSEISALHSSHADVVKLANDRNVATLIGFIGDGVRDGSIRPCDLDVAAQAIIGMLAWSQLLPQWSNSKQVQTLRTRTSRTMIDLLSQGLSRRDTGPFQCRLDVEQFQPAMTNVFDRRESSIVKIDQVLATASRIFNRKGIEATSFDEIGAALGVTRGLVYHYLNDKTDLVTRCYERAFDLYDQFAEAAKAHGANGLESALINAHLNIQAHVGTLSPLMPQPGFEAVPDAVRAPLRQRAYAENKFISDMLRQGIADGSANACDAPLVTHICAGAFGWIPKWLPPDSVHTPFQMGDEICTILALGLRAP
jgi:AcrR family transcriptional regulator